MKLRLGLKIFQETKGQEQMASVDFYQISKEELMPILKLFLKVAEGGIIQSSFYKANVIVITKSDQYITKIRKLQTNITDEHRCKNTNKILASRIQQHIEKIIHHDQVEFIPSMQDFFSICKSTNAI